MTLFLSLQPSSYEGFVKTTLAAIKLLTNLGFVIHRQRLQFVNLQRFLATLSLVFPRFVMANVTIEALSMIKSLH